MLLSRGSSVGHMRHFRQKEHLKYEVETINPKKVPIHYIQESCGNRFRCGPSLRETTGRSAERRFLILDVFLIKARLWKLRKFAYA